MMNIRNLGQKERLGVKLNNGICTKMCLKVSFENDWYFCNITESLDGFESKCPETKFRTVTS